MPGTSKRVGLAGALSFALVLSASLPSGSFAQASPSTSTNALVTITNLAQLSRAIDSSERLSCNLRLEFIVCASSSPEMGVVVARDPTGVEVLELGRCPDKFSPGEQIRLEGEQLLLRRRDMGTQISATPVVANDGLHAPRAIASEVVLKAGDIPLELDWFNGFHNFALEVFCQPPNGPEARIPDSVLWHAPSDQTPDDARLPGLRVQCYEGYWEQVPDFALLHPVKTGIATNFDLQFRTQDECVGLRFTGFFQAPIDGKYTFRVTSDDGSVLFLGGASWRVTRLGTTTVPEPQNGLIGQPMDQLQERCWMSLAGRVSFASWRQRGIYLELRSGAEKVLVTVADAAGLKPETLLNTYVRAVGVARPALSGSQRVVLDRLCVASGGDLKCEEAEKESGSPPLRVMDIAQIQAMPLQEAILESPVRVRGVVTAANRSDHWVSLQDDTRGIFVDLHSVSNAFPAAAELWEVLGHTSKGNFAPIIVAEQIKALGRGRMPEPARPSWNQLANGSMDVQWVEFQGLVSGVRSNALQLLLPEGRLQVLMENHFEPELNQYQHAVVRIRGTLFAIWNVDTREVEFGSLLMRNGSVNMDLPPPADPFNAPTKTARDLLRFDAQATPFHPVKVDAQVLYVDSQYVFAMNDGSGLRLLPSNSAEFRPGDLVEAVGYPEISGPSPLLRQALVRKTGTASLPEPRLLTGPNFAVKDLDSTLVRIQAKLLAMHTERGSPVLELQSNRHLFVARLNAHPPTSLSLRVGSTLQVSGVFASSGRPQPVPGQVESFGLLLSSPADILVLSQPSWWTLERLGAVVGFLLVILMLAAGWITQLRRQVEQRTTQLQREIRERERAEHHRALEAERARIARDLHDDLGSSLTEIGALASTGQSVATSPDGSPHIFNAIAGKARGSIAALDVIVWAVDPEDNSLQSMADYLSGFVAEYLAHFNVACRFKIPVSLPDLMFEGRVRHDVFLAVKESLNNVVRHAQATEVEFGLITTPDRLELVIADNGRGFDPAAAMYGNGLKNLRDRLAKLGGTCLIASQLGHGTTIRIRLPLGSVGQPEEGQYSSSIGKS